MYMCVKGIDLASIHNFPIGFQNRSDGVIFFFFKVLHVIQIKPKLVCTINVFETDTHVELISLDRKY